MSGPRDGETNATNPFFRSRKVSLRPIGPERGRGAPVGPRRHSRRRRLKNTVFVILAATLIVVFVGAFWYAKSEEKTEKAIAPAFDAPTRLLQPEKTR